jgi:hypothetical protein
MRLITNILLLSLLLPITYSCNNDENDQAPRVELSFDCPEDMQREEIFIVIEEEPLFDGSLQAALTIPDISLISFGDIELSTIISDEGSSCLSEVTGTGVTENNLMNISSQINNLPNWRPGMQNGIARNTLVCIRIEIRDGEVVSVEQEVGRCS